MLSMLDAKAALSVAAAAARLELKLRLGVFARHQHSTSNFCNSAASSSLTAGLPSSTV
jgi:hypothetical protein